MEQMRDTGTSSIVGRRQKILIVDDNRFNRELLKGLLKGDYDIEEAADGNEAYTILKNKYRELSIILLDLVMPNCDGFEFLERVKEDPFLSTVPIITLTADFAENNEERCLELGATDFLTKPYQPAIIKARVRNIVRMREIAASMNAIEFDELTGLYTKQAFYYRAKELLDSNPDIPFEVVISDVENFSLINSVYGMKKGDELLRSFAQYSRECCPQGICGRYGADQMISIYPMLSTEETEEMKHKFKKFKEDAPIPNVILKYGIYQNVDRTLSISDICDRAFLALKSVKHNHTRVSAEYDGPLSQYQLKMRVYERRFQEAIQNREFVVWYQPKYDINTKKMIGAEALVRWNTPDGMISPGEFLGIFETNGQIVQLDEYVFRCVCEYQKKRKSLGHELMPISVNLSRGSLFGTDVVERYKKIVDVCGIEPKDVPIEITESVTAVIQTIRKVADGFYEAGFCWHMDDFGSGQSSLNGLNVLRFDVVKMDKSLIDYIDDKSGELILKHTIALAKELGLHLVAEGVENERQFDFLKENGCDTVQGYLFSKPLPQEEFDRKVAEHLTE